ncbi:mechanosensitive ion channel family protein, partial [Patescibacteria group bacterium]|nr:mechanosensitive ion channel family protein [Patescibacteria group bacterium]
RFRRIAEKSATDVDDLIVNIFDSIGNTFFFFVALFISMRSANISGQINDIINKASIIIFLYYSIKILSNLIKYGFSKLIAQKKQEEKQDLTLIKVLGGISQVVLWIIAILILLQNFNFNVSTLVGGLGITGIAVAFGLQNVLKDVFSFISILIDKPFKVGDSIEIDSTFGTVRQIGIRSTRIKTLTGDELIIPNQDISQSRIRNFYKLKKRRVEFDIGVEYSTSSHKLEKIPQIIQNIIQKSELCEFIRCNFKKFGDSALIFETVYKLDSSSYTTYMQIREQINLAIVKEFKKVRINMAFPTQTIHLKK